MTAFPYDEAVYAQSCAWIKAECTSVDVIARAVGTSSIELEALANAEVLPAVTYSIYDTGIVSPIASIGNAGGLIDSFYGPAAVAWLRRACVYGRQFGGEALSAALQVWLRQDFRSALLSQSVLATRFGWSHLFQQGQLVPGRFDEAVAKLWDEWLLGGWAVCLRRFSGYDVVTKDIELERIPFLANSLSRVSAVDLIDAMLRFDSVVRAFAPFERQISSRYRVIDLVSETCDLPWPGLAKQDREASDSACRAPGEHAKQ